ncbi:Plasmid stabilization system [Candidatus Promineifilum breve]|uniref:Plasmid stabilization system n=1 Tax=Candidatus Promineifilum breve TaxID=1806508 RepID=A0A160T7F2_9CHLR|nr:type II toxin-antitoxin system RelE/ParE family toxin [Candidatus Promineifilum breve]CUS06014.1 Plasmid stabilization system [Candidatus Promineifilum breve]
MYRLQIKRSAEADLRRLPAPVFARINERLLTLRDEPRPPGVRKLQGQQEGWRIRVGEYRVIYLIDDSNRLITIVRVRHRRDVYKT